MSEEKVSAKTTVSAPVEAVFDVLADPTTHEAIDGTGWVRGSLDGKPLTETGQIFRMGMYHDNHPEKNYEMTNRVEVFEPTQRHRVAAGSGTGRPRQFDAAAPSSNSAAGSGATTSSRSATTGPKSR